MLHGSCIRKTCEVPETLNWLIPGIIPLYMGYGANGTVWFSSELKGTSTTYAKTTFKAVLVFVLFPHVFPTRASRFFVKQKDSDNSLFTVNS